MPITPTVPPPVQLRVKEMYEERDTRGRRIWSYASIAKALDLTETTVYRICNGLGAYVSADRFKDSATLAAESAASAQKLLELLKAEPPAAPIPQPQGETVGPDKATADRTAAYGVAPRTKADS